MSNSQCTTRDSAFGYPLGAGPLSGFVKRVIGLPVAALEVLLTWQARANERRHLRRLDDRLLSDVGLSRADIEREAALPFWRAS